MFFIAQFVLSFHSFISKKTFISCLPSWTLSIGSTDTGHRHMCRRLCYWTMSTGNAATGHRHMCRRLCYRNMSTGNAATGHRHMCSRLCYRNMSTGNAATGHRHMCRRVCYRNMSTGNAATGHRHMCRRLCYRNMSIGLGLQRSVRQKPISRATALIHSLNPSLPFRARLLCQPPCSDMLISRVTEVVCADRYDGVRDNRS